MTLTPLDVENVEFPQKTFGGYHPDAVHEFLEEVVKSLVELIRERDSLKEKVAKLSEEIEGWRAKEQLVSQSVQLAQQTRDQVINSAQAEAENIVKEARLLEVALKNELSALKTERELFEFEFYGLLRGFLEKLESRNPALKSGADSRGSIIAGSPSAPDGAPGKAQ
ncbi:MAG: DivIVA domain-containing protein [bacterium]